MDEVLDLDYQEVSDEELENNQQDYDPAIEGTKGYVE